MTSGLKNYAPATYDATPASHSHTAPWCASDDIYCGIKRLVVVDHCAEQPDYCRCLAVANAEKLAANGAADWHGQQNLPDEFLAACWKLVLSLARYPASI